jgi:hypothetical protein
MAAKDPTAVISFLFVPNRDRAIANLLQTTADMISSGDLVWPNCRPHGFDDAMRGADGC